MPRAELRAIHHCLLNIKRHATIKHVTIYPDCKMAVDRIRKGRQYTSRTQLGQLWSILWDEYEACINHGIVSEVIKVKSHETDIEKVPKVLQDGNNCADYHAGQAAIECPTGEANRIRNIDSKARWFQERRIQAILLLPKKGRHPQESQHIG